MKPAFILTPFLMLLLPALARAADPVPSPATDLAGSLGQMLFGLVVVIALLVACLWAIKRLSQPRNAAGVLKVLGATAVGPRERVVLVETGPKVLVLGVAPGSVRTLHILEASDFPTDAATNDTGTVAGGDFAGWFRKALERRHGA
ncbi:flagellar biosynthetic protein FliO [Parazoarcus communis]